MHHKERMSLQSGGKQRKFIEPTQREGLALSVGAAMQWSKLVATAATR